MADKPTKLVVNCITGESSIVPLTDEEIAANKLAAEQLAAEKAAEKTKQEAIALAKTSAIAKLTALGLTEEEAQAII